LKLPYSNKTRETFSLAYVEVASSNLDLGHVIHVGFFIQLGKQTPDISTLLAANFEDLTVVFLGILVFCDVTLCRWLGCF
jgi:hypothetical protein